VVLEILREVAELAGLRDRGDDVPTPRAFELGQFGAKRIRLALGQELVLYHLDLPPRRRDV